MKTTLNFDGSSKTKKKQVGDTCKGAPDVEFEQDWSFCLGDGQKIKKYFSTFRDFSVKSR